MKNKKGFTLIELLAVIVVLGIIMLIAVTSVSGVIEKTKKDAFLATARSYVDAVRTQSIMNGTLPSCDGGYKTVYLNKTMVEKGGITSPYGNQFQILENSTIPANIDDLNADISTAVSFIEIYGETEDGNCQYEYDLYLSDGVMGIGCYLDNHDSGNAVGTINLDTNDVARIENCQINE